MNSNNNKSDFHLDFQPFSNQVVPVLATILLLQMLIGLAGNATTVFVITNSKKLKKDPFMNVIVSLCCSDLLSASVSWILLYRRTWGFNHFNPVPNFFCNLFFSVDLMTSFTTSLHIFFFALMRFRALKSPFTVAGLKLCKIRIILATLWLLAFVSGFVPMFYFSEAKLKDHSEDNPNARWPACTLKAESLIEHRTYQVITYTTFLFLPAFGIIATSYLINHYVRNRTIVTNKSERESKKEKQASFQLLLIVLLFIIGYIPMATYDLWALSDLPSNKYYRKLDYWFGMSAYICLRTTECLNPIIYNVGSSKIRSRTKYYWRKYITRRTVESSESSDTPDTNPPPTISKIVDTCV